MKSHSNHVNRATLFNSLALSTYIAWTVLFVENSEVSSYGNYGYAAWVALFIGFLGALGLSKVIKYEITDFAYLLTFPILLLMHTLMRYLHIFPQVTLLMLYLGFTVIFYFSLPCYVEGRKQATIKFCFTMFFLAAIMLILNGLLLEPYRKFLSVNILISAILLVGCWLFSQAARGRVRRYSSDMEVIITRTMPKYVYYIFTVTAFGACFSVAITLVPVLSTEVGSGSGSISPFLATAVFLIFVAIYSLLLLTDNVEKINYLTFVAFFLGSFLKFVVPDSGFLSVFPYFLLVATAPGLLLLFFIFALQITSEKNRRAVTIIVYMLSILLAAFALFPNGITRNIFVYAKSSDMVANIVSSISVALMIFLAPQLLKPKPEPVESEPIAAEIQTSWDEIFRQEITPEYPNSPDSPYMPNKSNTPNTVKTGNTDSFFSELSAAEQRVYQRVLLGYSNQKIANDLFISINTVKFHVKNILSKSGFSNKSELISSKLREKMR